MSILITGGAGFIGSHLVEQLLTASDEPLVVVDNFNDYYDPQLKQANVAAWKSHPEVTMVEGDYGDSDLSEGVLLEHRPRVICHLAASPGVPASLKHPREYFEN